MPRRRITSKNEGRSEAGADALQEGVSSFWYTCAPGLLPFSFVQLEQRTWNFEGMLFGTGQLSVNFF